MVLDPPDLDSLGRTQGYWWSTDGAITPPLDSIRRAAKMAKDGDPGMALHNALQFLEHIAEHQGISIEDAISNRTSIVRASLTGADLLWQDEVYENLHSSLQLPSGTSQGH